MVFFIFINVLFVFDIFESIVYFLNEEGYRKCIIGLKKRYVWLYVYGFIFNIS